MLIPDIDTRYEFQTMGGDGGSKKAEKGEKRTIEDEVDGKRKRSDDSDSDTELKKSILFEWRGEGRYIMIDLTISRANEKETSMQVWS